MSGYTLEDIVSIDVETNHWDKEIAVITQVAALSCRSSCNSRIMTPFGHTVNPGETALVIMQPSVVAVTGLTPQRLRREGISNSKAMEKLTNWIDENDFRIVASHNWPFDLAALKRCGMDLTGVPFIDTLRCMREFYDVGDWIPGGNTLPDFKLGTCYYGIMPVEMWDDEEWRLHDAFSDAKMVTRIIEELVQHHKKTIEELVTLSATPFVPRFCPMGKHKGQPWKDVPDDYLRWMSDKKVYSDDEGLEIAVLTAMNERGMI